MTRSYFQILPSLRYVLAIALAILWSPQPVGSAPPSIADDTHPVTQAMQLLKQWRYAEAREKIEALAATHGQNIEFKYLQAEMAFLDGKYDRAADLLDPLPNDSVGGQVGHLKSLVGPTADVTRNFASKPSSGGHFVIFYPPGKDEVIVDLAGEVLEAAYQNIGQDLGVFPSEPIRVEILSQPSDLARLSPLTEAEIKTSGTIALCKYGKLMVVSPRATIFGYPWMDTLAHEYVHFVIATGSRDTVPVWLHEGLARFEQIRWRDKATGKPTPMDTLLIAEALKKNELITFDEMHPSMAKLPSQQATALAFAEVHSMIGYLHQHVGYEGFRKVIELVRDGSTAREAVAKVMQTSWNLVEKRWKKHLRANHSAADKSLQSRAHGKRIRFTKDEKRGESEGGEENIGIDEVKSKKARKHARLGGLLRARGLSAAAAVEYEKAIQFAGDKDPFIAAKLSRTYLALRRYDDAIKLAAPLAAADANDAVPATTLGIAYLAKKDYQKARTAFEAALRVSPFDPSVRCGLKQAYQHLGESTLETREQFACQRLRN